MRKTFSVLSAALCLCLALPAAAQNIGILQSAETNNQGTVKLMVAPLMSFGSNDADDEFGIMARVGYGFTGRFDAEAKVGLSENGSFFGADGELWLLKDAGLDISLTGGLHWLFGDGESLDTMGFEITPLVSGHVTESLELFGALDVAFESVQDAPAGVDDSYTRVHLVPGIEYRLSDAADLVAEFGVGLNDNSSEYVSAGIAFYFR
jgi:hypothetical protein